jgi:hypothetical protein
MSDQLPEPTPEEQAQIDAIRRALEELAKHGERRKGDGDRRRLFITEA